MQMDCYIWHDSAILKNRMHYISSPQYSLSYNKLSYYLHVLMVINNACQNVEIS